MQQQLEAMWARKLGLRCFDAELVNALLELMVLTQVDYTMLFRRLSATPEDLTTLKESFYGPSSEPLNARWLQWLQRWRQHLSAEGDLQETSAAMMRVNPAVAWREWLIAPAYEQAARGDTSAVQELQTVFSRPYDELPPELDAKYDRLRPREFLNAGGVSHYSCSS